MINIKIISGTKIQCFIIINNLVLPDPDSGKNTRLRREGRNHVLSRTCAKLALRYVPAQDLLCKGRRDVPMNLHIPLILSYKYDVCNFTIPKQIISTRAPHPLLLSRIFRKAWHFGQEQDAQVRGKRYAPYNSLLSTLHSQHSLYPQE